MDFILKEVPICADKEFEMIKITDDVRKVVEESGVEKGIVYVITEHTTTGITVNERRAFYEYKKDDRRGFGSYHCIDSSSNISSVSGKFVCFG